MPKLWQKLTPITITDDLSMKTGSDILVLTLVLPGLLVFSTSLYCYYHNY